MLYSTIALPVILALGKFATATPTPNVETRGLDHYATFYDDSGCSVNGGEGVDIYNTGCLGEAGRGSVSIPNTGLGTTGDNQFCLVKTYPDGSCSCQSQGYTFTATGFCAVLDPNVQSYRFVGGACGGNNC